MGTVLPKQDHVLQPQLVQHKVAVRCDDHLLAFALRLDALHQRSQVRERKVRLRLLDQHDLRAIGLSTHRSEEHTSELQSLMRTSYAVFCLKKKKKETKKHTKISK